jgi:spermidine/putrescine transport system ATP-binding protein
MSDRIAVMNLGEVLQLDTPRQLYEQPATRFAADFIGETNFLKALIDDVTPETATLVVGDKRFQAQAAAHLSPRQSVTLAIRPEKLQLTRPSASVQGNALTGAVREVVYIGTDTRYVIALPHGETLVARVQNLGARAHETFASGDAVLIACAPEDARILTV